MKKYIITITITIFVYFHGLETTSASEKSDVSRALVTKIFQEVVYTDAIEELEVIKLKRSLLNFYKSQDQGFYDMLFIKYMTHLVGSSKPEYLSELSTTFSIAGVDPEAVLANPEGFSEELVTSIKKAKALNAKINLEHYISFELMMPEAKNYLILKGE